MNKLPDRPTNTQFLSASLNDLGEWFSRHDLNSRLDVTCIYCGRFAEQSDHVIPKSRGGKDETNIVPACTGCNASKGTKTPEEWLGIPNEEIYYGSPRHIGMAKT